MASDGQRQRRLAAKAARRKAVVAEKKKSEMVPRGVGESVALAAKGAVVRCVAPAELFQIGIGHMVVARSLPSGRLGCVFFLVDVFCLGLKDAFYRDMGRDELQSALAAQSEVQTFVEVDVAWARKLIRDAVAFAAEFGLAAAKEYRAVEPIFGDTDANACGEVFTFGRDGKPFFVPGPSDTPARIRTVTRTLQERLGAEGWDYLLAAPNE